MCKCFIILEGKFLSIITLKNIIDEHFNVVKTYFILIQLLESRNI